MARKKNRYNKAHRNEQRRRAIARKLLTFLKLAGLVTAVGSMSLVFVVGYYAVIEAPYFQVKGVEITGCNRVERTALLERMGIKPGTNILGLNLNAITRSIENLDWVERVSIRRRLPDRLVVRLWEREPWLLIHLNRLYYLDKNGVVFKGIQRGDNMDYPVVTGISRELYFNNSLRSREVVGRVMRVATLIAESKAPFGFDQVSEIHVDEGDGITLIVNRGVKVHLGAGNFDKKFHRLTIVYNDLHERGRWPSVTTIDLDLGNRVLVT
jgi:cell division protein FtsQ